MQSSEHIRINGLNLIVFLLALALMLVAYFSVPTDTYCSKTWAQQFTVYATALLLFQVIVLYLMAPKKRLLIYIVLILAYLFNFSQIALFGVGYEFEWSVYSSSIFRFYPSEVVESSVVAIHGIIGLFIGITLFFVFDRPARSFSETREIVPSSLSIPFIVVGLVFDLLMNGIYAYNSVVYGYSVLQSIDMPYVIRLLSYLLLPGVLLAFSDKNISEKNKRIVLYLFCGYKLITMITGFRAYALINIFICYYFYYRRVSKSGLTVKNVIILLILLQILSGILVGVRNSRSEGVDLALILTSIVNPASNVIANMISEFGITIGVIAADLQATGGVGVGGQQLLASFLSVIPGANSIFSNVDFESATMDTALSIHSLGGSYLGDLLFDFGADSIGISAAILGFMAGWLYEWFEQAIANGDGVKAALASPIIVDFLYCVRSSLAKTPRMIVWYLIAALILRILFSRKPRTSPNSVTTEID